MSDVFSDAIEDEIAEVNPTRGIKITGQRKSAETMEENHEFFSEEEMNYIWACAKKERLQVRLEIEIMSMTGCRVGELVALKWADVCLEKGKESITIAHSASSVRGRGMVIGPTKSGGARRISITIDTVRLIKEYSASKPILDINGYIFEGETPGKPISTASVRYHLKQMEKKYEIEGFHPHKLRHTYGSLAVQYGAPITAVSKALGHQDLSTTMEYYLHSDDTASKIVNNTLEKIRKIS